MRPRDMEGQLAEAQRQHAVLSRKLDRISFALASADQRLQESLAKPVQARQRAHSAGAQLRWLLSGISWRLTTPLRWARRLQQRRQAGEASSVRPAAAGPTGKEVARQVFHHGMRRLLRMPGGRQTSRLVRLIAPRLVEWLALRYRAYDRWAAELPSASPVTVEERDPVFVAGQMAPLDLSEEEARLYRQLSTSGRSTKH